MVIGQIGWVVDIRPAIYACVHGPVGQIDFKLRMSPRGLRLADGAAVPGILPDWHLNRLIFATTAPRGEIDGQ